LKERLTVEDAWKEQYPQPNVVIVDPPRSGMHPKVINEVVKLGAERIIYVSCNPTTQARDLRMMCATGSVSSDGEKLYELAALQPVDMFPHTYHVETVALLERKKDG
jgi:23S rRNA (uracil1939-C5)-methyltransferase